MNKTEAIARATLRMAAHLPASILGAGLQAIGGRRGLNRAGRFVFEHVRDGEKKRRVGRAIARRHSLIALRDFPGATLLESIDGYDHVVPLPRVAGLTDGGQTSVRIHDETLYALPKASFQLSSDFVRGPDAIVANPKFWRKEAEWAIPADVDFVDRHGGDIYLTVPQQRMYVSRAISLCGVYADAWAHFLISYYPKLAYLHRLPADEPIDVIIPRSFDSHMRYLIDREIGSLPHVRVREIGPGVEVFCDVLYHVTLGTFVLDRGVHPTPYDVQIAKSTTDFLRARRDTLTAAAAPPTRRLFIGRRGGRNLTNYQDVLRVFARLGFDEVFPHQLSIEQKITLFAEASVIVGPGSSGFANLVYSRPGARVLEFINVARAIEPTFPALCIPLGIDFTFMTGRDVDTGDLNSSYTIDVADIEAFIASSGLLE